MPNSMPDALDLDRMVRSPTSGNQHQSLKQQSPNCADPQSTGIDTGLSGPVSGTHWVASLGSKVTDTSTVDVITGEVERWHIWVQGDLPFKIELSPDGAATLVTECSLPRRHSGSNLNPLNASHARDEVLGVYRHFDLYAGWRVPVDDLRVRRLDAATDFINVTELPRLLPALASVSAPAERRNPGLFYDRERGGALTLSRGSREYERSLIYDKEAEVEYRHRRAARDGQPRPSWEVSAAVNVARFETQARSPYLQRQGVLTVADMTQDAVDGLAQGAWARHALGTHVADIPTVLRALEASGLSPAKQSAIFYHLARQCHGRDCQMAAGSCVSHRKEIRRLGLTMDYLDGRRPEIWLDFETKRQMTRSTEN